jgi:hypothetical protein
MKTNILPFTTTKAVLFLVAFLLLAAHFNCSEAPESDLNRIIDKYEKLYFDCGNQATKHKILCFKIYNTLASLYYTKEYKQYKEKSREFTSVHPVKYDSVFFADYGKMDFPKFVKTIEIYKEIVNKWGEDKLSSINFKNYLNALYFSENYSCALPLIDKILLKKLPNIEKETFEVMRYDCYLGVGKYDTAEVLLKEFLNSCKNKEYLKHSKLTLDNLDDIKKYSKPKK